MKNFGLLLSPRAETDFIAGRSPIDKIVLQTDGQWGRYLPEREYQRIAFETYACVSFSALNCIEALYKKLNFREVNFSDRFIAKMSGTTDKGNYLFKVADTIRHKGLVLESDYPYVPTYKRYYQEVPQNIKDKALKFLDNWTVYYEWVEDDATEIMHQLEFAPLQVTVRYASGNGILNPKGRRNHAVMLYGYKMNEYWEIFDSYNNFYKKYAWDYKFKNILEYSLFKKHNIMKFKDNTLIQLVEGNGGFGLFLKDSLIIDKTDKILASFIVRNKGDIKGRTQAVDQIHWDSVPHYNLKGERI